jgi:lipopolysaccharide transport system permease protein
MMALARLRNLANYRGFIMGSVQREFQSKYRNSILGAAWMVLNPLAMIVVYTVVFSQVMRSRLAGSDAPFAYSIFLCAGVLTWGLFAEITTRGQSVFVEHAGLIKKISFPRLCLPVIVVMNALVNFAIIFGLFTVFLIISGNFPGLAFLAVIPVLAIQIMLAIGLGVTLGVLNVFFRDVGQFYTIALQFWFWFTPVVYPVTALPEQFRGLLAWNPMAPVIMSYQRIFVDRAMPHWGSLIVPAALAILLCMLGMHLFQRRAGEMVDEL